MSYTEGNPFFISELLPVLDRGRRLLVERNGVSELHDDAHFESGMLRLTGTLSGSDIPVRVADVLESGSSGSTSRSASCSRLQRWQGRSF